MIRPVILFIPEKDGYYLVLDRTTLYDGEAYNINSYVNDAYIDYIKDPIFYLSDEYEEWFSKLLSNARYFFKANNIKTTKEFKKLETLFKLQVLVKCH